MNSLVFYRWVQVRESSSVDGPAPTLYSRVYVGSSPLACIKNLGDNLGDEPTILHWLIFPAALPSLIS